MRNCEMIIGSLGWNLCTLTCGLKVSLTIVGGNHCLKMAPDSEKFALLWIIQEHI